MRFSGHAIDKFRERTGSKQSDQKVENRLIKMFNRSEKVRPKPKFRVDQLLNHNLKEVEYRKFDNFIFVVDGDMIVTVYRSDPNKWEHS